MGETCTYPNYVVSSSSRKQHLHTMITPARSQGISFNLHTSFSPLIPLYHAFLLDQFGVLHNGSQGLHGAVESINRLLHPSSGEPPKKLAILSNTSSPSSVALERLKKYGLNEEMFVGGLVSSGEECSKFVRENYCSKKALWFTWEESETQNPLQFLSHCETENRLIEVANSVADADFILLHGSQVWRRCRESISKQDKEMAQDLNFLYDGDFSILDPILNEAANKNKPMVCANPDLIVGLPGGLVGNMPGEPKHCFVFHSICSSLDLQDSFFYIDYG